MNLDDYITGTFDNNAPFNQPADKSKRCDFCGFWTYEVELTEFEGFHICLQCLTTEKEAEKRIEKMTEEL